MSLIKLEKFDDFTTMVSQKRGTITCESPLTKRHKTSSPTHSSNPNSPARGSISPSSTSSSHSSSSNTHTHNHHIHHNRHSPPSTHPTSSTTASLLSLLFNTTTNTNTIADPKPTIIRLQSPTCQIAYTDLDDPNNNVVELQMTMSECKLPVQFTANLRSYLKSHYSVDTLLKFANTYLTMTSYKLLLYNSSEYFRRKYDMTTSHANGTTTYSNNDNESRLLVIDIEPHLSYESMRTCLEYIHSMGTGDIDMGMRSNFGQLKLTAQYLGLTDLVRIVEVLLERQPQPPPPPILPQPLAGSQTTTSNNNNNNAQHLSQIYTNLVLEQFLKQMCNNESRVSTSSSSSSSSSLSLSSSNGPQLLNIVDQSNSRFANLFARCKLDFSRFRGNFELDTISRDLIIKDKYVYPSQEEQSGFLDSCFDNLILINLEPLKKLEKAASSSEFLRHTLIIFSINLDSSLLTTTTNSHSSSTSDSVNTFKLYNFVIKSRLNFTDLGCLKDEIARLFEQFLNQVLTKCLSHHTHPQYDAAPWYRCVVNRVCYLKKPSNCKTIRVETIKSSTDCFRAIVEYSRLNEHTRELPYVLLTTHSSVYAT